MADNFIACHCCNLILPLTNIKNIFIIKSGTFCHKIGILGIKCNGEIELKISNLVGVQVMLMLAGIMCMLFTLYTASGYADIPVWGDIVCFVGMFTPFIGMILFGIGLFTTCKSDSENNDEADKKENEEDF